MKKAVLLLATAIPLASRACYNDRDTLGYELRNRPDVQRALTGRFERNPPLYYEMRVVRLRSQPRLSSAETDDLAVALDRLGRSDEALVALARKRPTSADERYRFYANRGTIRAHRWLRHRAARSGTEDLRDAESDIALALKLNPTAHFGREGTQLEVIRWLQKPETTLGEALIAKLGPDVAEKGLAGLIVLGAAWESPDVALALAEIEARRHRFALTELARFRYQELRASGPPLLYPSLAQEAVAEIEEYTDLTAPNGEPAVSARFTELRHEADAWNAGRTAFMLAKMRQGSHPDTDPKFWDGWNERAMPKIPEGRPLTPERWFVERGPTLLTLGATLLLLIALAIHWLRRRRRPGAVSMKTH